MKEYIMEVADNGMVSKVVQELIRCLDCKYSNPCDRQGFVTCNEPFFEKGFVRPDWFCADGVPKEGR